MASLVRDFRLTGGSATDKLPFNLDYVTKHLSKLRLRGGLAGKICHVLIFVAVSTAAITWAVRIAWVAVVSLILLFALVAVMLWRLINLADKNPQSALMEGGEFLLHEQMTIGTKSQPRMAVQLNDVVESAPVTLSDQENRLLDQPEDQTDQRLLPGESSGQEGI